MNLLRRLTFTALFATVLALSLTACGGASDEDLEKARQQGAEEQKKKDDDKEQEEKQEELEKKIEKLEKEAKKDGDSSSSSGGNSSGGNSGGNTGGSVANCGNGLTVGPNTTCSFAENVRSEWASAGGGSVTVDVYSPVTGATYTMRCTSGTTTVCRGGNNATVYIR